MSTKDKKTKEPYHVVYRCTTPYRLQFGDNFFWNTLEPQKYRDTYTFVSQEDDLAMRKSLQCMMWMKQGLLHYYYPNPKDVFDNHWYAGKFAYWILKHQQTDEKDIFSKSSKQIDKPKEEVDHKEEVKPKKQTKGETIIKDKTKQ